MIRFTMGPLPQLESVPSLGPLGTQPTAPQRQRSGPASKVREKLPGRSGHHSAAHPFSNSKGGPGPVQSNLIKTRSNIETLCWRHSNLHGQSTLRRRCVVLNRRQPKYSAMMRHREMGELKRQVCSSSVALVQSFGLP